jgi:hypothetical protein
MFNKRVVRVEKIEEIGEVLDFVRITFEDGETVEAAAKHIFPTSGSDGDEV